MFYEKFNVFFDAINNEIDVDKDVLNRIKRCDLDFVPLRVLKSIKYIDKYRVSSYTYGVLAFVFCIISPVYFFIQMVMAVFARRKNYLSNKTPSKKVVLVANGRVRYLIKKLNVHTQVKYININQPNTDDEYQIEEFLKLKDYLYAYLHAVFSVAYILCKLGNKKDILHVYVAYPWFLVYIALLNNKDTIDTVYFANHYDRWAVMFDRIFLDKEVVLLQHGVLSESLKLSYKLKHLNKIFVFDESSKVLFKKIFECSKVLFEKMDISLPLTEVSSNKNTVLMIGQPHSMSFEIDIIQRFVDKYDVIIKPHPLFDNSEYKKIKHVTVIDDINFYPMVDVVLCYESTLGYEYEASGIQVIWFKEMSMNEIAFQVERVIVQERA